MTISKDRVKPSPLPDSWKLKEIFATGVVLGSYMALMTAIFFWAAYETNFFPVNCKRTSQSFMYPTNTTLYIDFKIYISTAETF